MTLVRCLTTPPQARRCHRNMPFAALLLCSQVMRPPAQQLQLLRSSTSAMSHVLPKIPHDLAEQEPNEGLQAIWLSGTYHPTPTCCHVCELQAVSS